MGLGFSELVIILLIVLILFGAGKLPKVMQEMGRGVKGFRDGMKEGEAGDKAGEQADGAAGDKPADSGKPGNSGDSAK